MARHTYVKKSRIHGRGVFARRRIPGGRCIGWYRGPRATRNSRYVLWLVDEDGAQTGILGRNSLRYLNHSSRPNAEFRGARLVSLRTILPDEEITVHYGPEWSGIG
jgi:hypothetical protein